MRILENEKDVLVFENDYIRREITFQHGRPVNSAVTRLSGGYTWTSPKETDIISLPGFDWSRAETKFEDNVVTFVSNYIVRWVFNVSDNQPAIRTQIFARALPDDKNQTIDLSLHNEISEDAFSDITECVQHSGNHIKLHRVRFIDHTDSNDSLVREDDIFIYNQDEMFDGNLFFLSDPISGETCMIQKESPVGSAHLNRLSKDLKASVSRFTVMGSGIDYGRLSSDYFTAGYPVTIALCATEDYAHTARMAYTSDCGGFTPFIMSNTWGDRSQDKAVCESFIKEEILCAEKLGVDIVQIDDGWQIGKSVNSAFPENGVWSSGFYNSNPYFWAPDPQKFPNGFGELCQFAQEHHVELGLWFSPDADNDYENWQKDAEILLGFYNTYGIRHFKLDGMVISSKTAEKNFLNICSLLMKESNWNITLQMDITSGQRLGYFYEKQLGTLFVENRYTDWGNYYPHNTLRNLWQLSRYIPSQKMLFEVLNLRRNVNMYTTASGEIDLLAPVKYDIDYVFASVMVANPLIWCEMQHLNKDDALKLSLLIAEYKQVRNDFIEVIPSGECPDGFSLTGFYIRGAEYDYYIGLRELSEKDTVFISVEKILYTNDAKLKVEGNKVVFSDQRKYFFARISKKAD